MRPTIIAAALALGGTLSQPAAAQTTYRAGRDLVFTGGQVNGFNIALISAQHSGNKAVPVQITLLNRQAGPRILFGTITLRGTPQNDQRKRQSFTLRIEGSTQAAMRRFEPFGGTLAGTQVTIAIQRSGPG
jgi:hypothetical protein